MVKSVDGKSLGTSGPKLAHVLLFFIGQVPAVSQVLRPTLKSSVKTRVLRATSTATSEANAQMSARVTLRALPSNSATMGANVSIAGLSPLLAGCARLTHPSQPPAEPFGKQS